MEKNSCIKSITRHIPNFLTCLNLLCGCLAVILIFQGDFINAAYLVFAAAVIDFFDGFAARMLKAYSAIGKDLDSLADMVTFGVVPGMMLFQLFNKLSDQDLMVSAGWHTTIFPWSIFSFSALLIPVFSALRLAKFNNDTRQTESFVGLPTPANAMLICSLPFILESCMNSAGAICSGRLSCYVESVFLNPWLFLFFCCLMSFLLVAELPLFSLKFKTFGFKGNEIRYVMLLLSLIILVLLKFSAIPFIIFLYIFLSILNNLIFAKSKVNQ